MKGGKIHVLSGMWTEITRVLHQIDGQGIPDLTSRDPVSDLPVIFVINEKQAVRIDAVAAPAGQTVEKAAGERVE